MSSFETVLYQVSDQVATVTLNRPQARNSFNTQLRLDFLAALKLADEDASVKVIVVAASGKGFCAGADLSEELPDRDGFITELLHNEYLPPLQLIANSGKPVIAAVNGAAAGIGAALAMTCDLCVMAEDAFLYSAFGAISLVPDGGFHWHLVNQVGSKRAYEMILESQRLSAEECLDLGLVNKVVATDELLERTTEWAKKLTATAPLTASYSKAIIGKVKDQSLEESMALEAEIQNTCIRSKDFKEGAQAFFEKRAPSFSGE